MFPILSSFATLFTEGRVDVPKNSRIAFALASLGVRHGCPHCKGVLARCFLGGIGCDESIVVAKYLAEKSASAGSRYGHFVLGYLAYDIGHIELAKYHWQIAADLGLAVAQVNLGMLFLNESHALRLTIEDDQGSERAALDSLILEADAFDLFIEACKKGHPKAWQELGVMYFHGIYVALNMDKASACFKRSRKAGNVELLLA